MTTRRPTARSVTAEPTASTRPAASWPRSIGTGRTRLPSSTDRSEWHTPAASIRTRTSVGPGPSSSTVATLMGAESAYGRGSPIRSSTAPVIRILSPSLLVWSACASRRAEARSEPSHAV